MFPRNDFSTCQFSLLSLLYVQGGQRDFRGNWISFVLTLNKDKPGGESGLSSGQISLWPLKDKRAPSDCLLHPLNVYLCFHHPWKDPNYFWYLVIALCLKELMDLCFLRVTNVTALICLLANSFKSYFAG